MKEVQVRDYVSRAMTTIFCAQDMSKIIIRYSSHTFSSGRQLTLANVYQDFLTETLQHKVQAFLEETFHDSMPFDRDHLDIAAILQLQCVEM